MSTSQEPRRSRWWLAAAGLCVLPCAKWVVDQAEVAPTPVVRAEASDPPVVKPTPSGVREEPLPEVGHDSGPALADETAAAELVERWRRALELAAVVSVGDAAQLPPGARDAGASADAGCVEGPVTIPPATASVVDVVVAIDTSGSMTRWAPSVARWLEALGTECRQTPGCQLTLVVDQLALTAMARRRGAPVDAGQVVKAAVASDDALSVLERTEAKWLARLRPDARTHVLVVTDDDPAPGTAQTLVATLTAQAEGRLGTAAAPSFTFDAVLGYQPTRAGEVLTADLGVVEQVCGVRAGAAYQRLTQQLGGLRASVCDLDQLAELRARVLESSRSARSCLLPLPAGAEVRALRADGQTLFAASPTAWDCLEGTRAYSQRRGSVSLCPKTCAALAEVPLELTLRCHP